MNGEFWRGIKNADGRQNSGGNSAKLPEAAPPISAADLAKFAADVAADASSALVELILCGVDPDYKARSLESEDDPFVLALTQASFGAVGAFLHRREFHLAADTSGALVASVEEMEAIRAELDRVIAHTARVRRAASVARVIIATP